MKRIVIGTRASKLAMIQTQWIVERLQEQWPGLEIAIEQISTKGDHIRDKPLTQIGGDGVFVKEIEHALHQKRIDLAVHSLKDLPTAQPEGLCIVVVGPREDVRDVLVSNQPKLSTNPRIGTCSSRRTAQIRALLPDAQILPLRGNVDTRLRKLDAGDYDGIVLAAAGLHRLALQERLVGRITYLPIEVMMPAPGQGALAVEMRDEPKILALIAPIENTVIQATTSAERMFMRRLGAGCYLPVAAYGEVVNEMLTLQGIVISLDGQRQVRVQQSMRWTVEASIERAERLGIQLAEQALAQGAAEIIAALDTGRIPKNLSLRGGRSGGEVPILQGKRILVTRTLQQASALSERLRALGAIPIEFPTIQIVPPQDWGPLDNALKRLCMTSYYTWLVFTSANGVNICFERLHSIGYDAGAIGNVRVAAIGPATAAALARYGVTADLVPHEYIAEGVAAALIEDAWQREESLQGKRILLARAAEARKILVSALQQAGAVVDEVVAYHTVSVASDDEQGREVLHLLQTHQLDILTFTSSSTVRNFMHWLIESCGEATQIDVVGEAGGGGPTPPPGREGIERVPARGTPTASSAEGPYGIASLAWLGGAWPKIACIGPITAQTAREFGLDVDIEAREFTIDGLVEAIVRDQEEA